MGMRGGSRALVALLGVLLAVSVIGALDREPTDVAGQDRSRPRSDRDRPGERESEDRSPRPRRTTGQQPAGDDAPARSDRPTVVVSRVVDGDTVELADGTLYRVQGRPSGDRAGQVWVLDVSRVRA